MLTIFTLDGGLFLLRWFHIFFGVLWIGLLYYFNFVQGAFMAEADAASKSVVTQKLLPRALAWFRWAAMGTFLVGWIYLGIVSHTLGMEFFSTSRGATILFGGILGSLMWFNVWFVIWPNQKVVIASATQVASGGKALEGAPAAAARALTASRTNVLFSLPMLFFMAAARHLPLPVTETSNFMGLSIVLAVIVLGIEANALKGKTGPMTSIKGVIHLGLGLTVVFYGLFEFFVRM